MQAEHGRESVGGQLGCEAVGHALRRAEDYCDAERQPIEAANQPKINARREAIQEFWREYLTRLGGQTESVLDGPGLLPRFLDKIRAAQDATPDGGAKSASRR
jgi:hypothetical protein